MVALTNLPVATAREESQEIVYAATTYKSNAELIEAVVKLGYIKPDDIVLDPTAGKMIWWKNYRPKNLVASSLDVHGVDFRNMPWPSDYFDVVAYDPPYVSPGGRQTTGLPEFHGAYGMTDTPSSPARLQYELINPGLTECARVTKPGGFILAKCQSYISSGKLWPGQYEVYSHGVSIGLKLWDDLVMVTSPRPQPSGRRQVHARRNMSNLLVFRKGK